MWKSISNRNLVGKGKPFSAEDIRFTTKGNTLYAIVLGWPENGKVIIKSLGSNSPHFTRAIQKVELVANGERLVAEQTANGLSITLP